MSTWDEYILAKDINTDFLEDMSNLEDDEVVEAVSDAITLAATGEAATDEEEANALAASTIAAIWAGAPFSAGDIVAAYPYIRGLVGQGDEELREQAAGLLEEVEADFDLEAFIEALA